VGGEAESAKSGEHMPSCMALEYRVRGTEHKVLIQDPENVSHYQNPEAKDERASLLDWNGRSPRQKLEHDARNK
jgi:hypothetical protein